MNRAIIRVALLSFVVAIVGCQTKEAKAPPQAGGPINVKAGELLTEYGTNAAAADGKYKGKQLRVTGKFGAAQKAPLMGYAVQVLPEDAGDVNLSGVECFMAESATADIGKMQPGQMITIQGTCDGQVLGQVKMSKCTVVQ